MFLRKKVPARKLVLLVACLKGLKKVSGLLPARLENFAYDEDPTEMRGLIIVVLENDKEQEYLVRFDNKHRGINLTSSNVKMDDARKIETREIEDGRFTRDISVMEDRDWLKPITSEAVMQTLRAKAGEILVSGPGYKARFIKHTPR